jgi:hypothetical protein
MRMRIRWSWERSKRCQIEIACSGVAGRRKM